MKTIITKVWNVNEQLVVADTIEEAIQTYRAYYKQFDDLVPSIEHIDAISNRTNYGAIIKSE
jgi:hypothetical protein